MEIIYATYTDGIKATFEGDDLFAKWGEVTASGDYLTGDYYRPSKHTPSKKTLFAYFGNINTTLPIS